MFILLSLGGLLLVSTATYTDAYSISNEAALQRRAAMPPVTRPEESALQRLPHPDAEVPTNWAHPFIPTLSRMSVLKWTGRISPERELDPVLERGWQEGRKWRAANAALHEGKGSGAFSTWQRWRHNRHVAKHREIEDQTWMKATEEATREKKDERGRPLNRHGKLIRTGSKDEPTPKTDTPKEQEGTSQGKKDMPQEGTSHGREITAQEIEVGERREAGGAEGSGQRLHLGD